MHRIKRFAGVTAASALALGAAACGGGGDAGGESLTVVMWGGGAQEAHVASYVQPWADENDVTVKQDQPTDYAKLRAQVESKKVSWGVVEVEPNFAVNACKEGLLEKIDTEVVDTSVLNTDFVSECAIPNLQYAFNIAYNTDTFKDAHPTSWAEFFDTEKFPGKRGFWKYATGGIFEAALLADGVKPDELYPLDIDRAFKKLDTIKDDIVFYETGDQQVQLVATGEAPLVQAWNGRISQAAEAGEPVANEYAEHFISYDTVVIPKGYPNADLAMEFLGHFVKDLEGQAADAKSSGYAPVNAKAMELVDDKVAAELPTSEQNASSLATPIDYDYWAANYDAVSARFNKWLSE